VSWLGRHYYLERVTKKPYTTINCLGPEAVKYREALLANFEAVVASSVDKKNQEG
jgi:hypothetical protein